MRPTEFRAGLQGSYIIYIERESERVRERGREERERGRECVSVARRVDVGFYGAMLYLLHKKIDIVPPRSMCLGEEV